MRNKMTTIIALLLTGGLPFAAPSPVHPAGLFTSAPDSWKQEMLDQVNLLRSKGCHCGQKYMPPVKPLRWSSGLEKAARAHVADMERHDFLGHRSFNGRGIGDRADKAGYKWRAIGENVACGQDSVKEVLMDWESSPSHCRNMMQSGFAEMGAAWEDLTWVQVFGSPAR